VCVCSMFTLDTGVDRKADLVLLQEPPGGRKGESESVTRRMKLDNEREFGLRCAREVALQRTN
jgi:hypothetical protein